MSFDPFDQTCDVCDLEAEAVAHAEESARALDLVGRALVHPRYVGLCDDDGGSSARVDAWYSGRDAVASAAGLVSVPTSDTRSKKASLPFHSRLVAEAARSVLAPLVDAFQPDPDATRIASLRRSVGFSARVHVGAVPPDWRCCMVTLTYAGTNADWSPLHVSAFVKRARQWCARRDVEFRYVWVAELQKRGVIHYHVAFWLPAWLSLPKPDQCGWWPHGMTKIETARNAVGYLMKYISKGGKASEHKLPGGARSYGVGGLGETFRWARRWLSLPGFIKTRADVVESAQWRRAPGGGWSDPDGVIWASEFRRAFVGGAAMLQRVLTHPKPGPVSGTEGPSGPFSWLRRGLAHV